MWPVVMFEG